VLPKYAEIVVIGGGVIGASIAYHLARENILPVVLEKEEIESGSSGACEGLILLQSKKPGIHLEMALASNSRFVQLSEELGCDIEYERRGGLVVIESEDQLESMKLFADRQRACGADLTFLDRKRTLEAEPVLSPSIAGATYSPVDGRVNPLLLTQAFLKAARRRGARIFTHAEVKGIGISKHRISAVNTTRGRIETSLVVNAAGALAAGVGHMVNLKIPIEPRRGQILVTEPAPPTVRHCLLSAGYIAAKFNPSLAASTGGFAVEQTANGNILIGSTREFAGLDRKTTCEGIHAIADRILRVLPVLADLHIIRTFAGLRPYTPDGLPILGPVEGLEGFIMAAGHEGDGITLSPITGEIIAKLITRTALPFSLDPFRLERFATVS